LDADVESSPYFVEMGTRARMMKSMPISTPAIIAKEPATAPR